MYKDIYLLLDNKIVEIDSSNNENIANTCSSCFPFYIYSIFCLTDGLISEFPFPRQSFRFTVHYAFFDGKYLMELLSRAQM